MAQEVKISVIMPVYKVEKYVGKAIESMLSQTLKEFEFLIVDDGTPDNSGAICDEYAAKDGRIKVIHKENGGAPSARNMAMDMAVGKYMFFMDSDDWVEPNMLEDMYLMAEKNDAQLVVAGFYIHTYYNDDEYVTTKLYQPDAMYDDQRKFRENAYKLFDKNLFYPPWNKLYLSSYLMENDIKFPQTFMDDFPFVLSVIRDVKNVVVTSHMYYHFIRARAESETAKYRSNIYEKREEEHSWMLELYDYWNVHDSDSNEMIQRRYIERVIGCIENLSNKACGLSAQEKKKLIQKMILDSKAINAVKIARPQSLLMKVMLMPVKWQNATLAYWEGKAIAKVKSGNVKVFASLKANR